MQLAAVEELVAAEPAAVGIVAGAGRMLPDLVVDTLLRILVPADHAGCTVRTEGSLLEHRMGIHPAVAGILLAVDRHSIRKGHPVAHIEVGLLAAVVDHQAAPAVAAVGTSGRKLDLGPRMMRLD